MNVNKSYKEPDNDYVQRLMTGMRRGYHEAQSALEQLLHKKISDKLITDDMLKTLIAESKQDIASLRILQTLNRIYPIEITNYQSWIQDVTQNLQVFPMISFAANNQKTKAQQGLYALLWTLFGGKPLT